MDITKYGLNVSPGSGWQGNNWLLTLAVPAYDIWPSHFVVIRGFKTEKEALDEAAKLVVDVVQSSSERR